MKKKIKVRKILKGAAGLAFVGLVVWFMAMKVNLDASTSNYDFVVPYEKRNLSTFVTAGGKIVMNDTSVVTSDVTQKIKTVHCRVGDIIKKGDVLCEFESGDLDDQIQKIQKIIDDSNALNALDQTNTADDVEFAKQNRDLTLQKAQLALDNANKSYEIAAKKYDEYYQKYYNCTDNDLSAQYYEMYKQYEDSLDDLQKDIDDCQSAYDNAKYESDLGVVSAEDQKTFKELKQSGIDEYKRQLEKLNAQKNNLVVKANSDGIIAESYAFEGSYPVNGELFRIGTLDNYKVEATVFSKDILNVRSGMQAAFSTTLTGAREINGTVTNISDVFNSRGYTADIQIDENDVMKLLKPDINASVKIYITKTDDLMSVAYDCIFTGDDDKKYVYRAEKNSQGAYTAHKIEVQTGAESDYYVEVSSSDLKEGDLIVGDAQSHHEGDRIKIKGMAE